MLQSTHHQALWVAPWALHRTWRTKAQPDQSPYFAMYFGGASFPDELLNTST